MDPLIKLMYSAMYQLDIDACIQIPQPHNNLEIKLEERSQSFTDFVKSRMELVTMEMASTREIAARSPFPHMFVEMVTQLGILRHKKEGIGYGYTVAFYNGLPTVFPNDFFEHGDLSEFDKRYQEALQKLVERNNPDDALVSSEHGTISRIYLYQDFVQENGIYRRRKKFGISLGRTKLALC